MKKKIVITAGHSNKDPGAVNGSHKEAEIVTNFRNALASKLRDDYQVFTDGHGNENQTLNEAITLVKINRPDLAIEFHLNAATAKTATGVESISLPQFKSISQALSKAVARRTGQRLRGEDGWIDQSKSARGKLGFVEAGGIIVELVFISNDEDLKKFLEFYWVVADDVAKVIKEYLK